MAMITSHGLRMPKLGFGTYRMKGEECRDAVISALQLGYRHIDTAQMYDNEAAVGAALKQSGVKREAIHLTTKVWRENLAPDALRAVMGRALEALQTDYVDLFLIHWPSPGMDLGATLDTMMQLQESGATRAIGVANFPIALLRQAVDEIGAPIVTNQVEYHVLLSQAPLLAYMCTKNIALTAYCPLAQGRLGDHPDLARIAGKHGVTAAQIALAWLLEQDNVAAIPKARGRERQLENLGAQNVTLDDEDHAVIDALPKNQRLVSPPVAPVWDEA